MFRRLFISLLLLVFMGMVPMGCFRCEVPDYAILREFSLFISEPAPGAIPFSEPVLDNGARTTATALLLSIRQLQYDYVSAPSLRPLFTSQALAWSCEDPGLKGLKDQVEAVKLTSKGLFNGVPAGQSLNQFVRGRTFSFFADTAEFPLDQLADVLNRRKYNNDIKNPISLRISPKPRDNAQQQFELRIRLQSGKEVTQTTPAIIWE